MGEHVEYGQTARLQNEQLSKEHRRYQCRVAEGIRGDRDAEVARVDVGRTEGCDDGVAGISFPQQSGHQDGDGRGDRNAR